MPTILSHTAVPLSVGLGLGRSNVSLSALALGVFLAILPDFDVLSFRLHIPYASDFGHRGFSHSLLAAVAIGLIGAWWLYRYGGRFWASFGFLSFSMASHGVLDCFTTGGKGIALLWPFSSTRFFAPVQVIRVAPLSMERLLTSRGAEVLISEIHWVWLPCFAVGLALFLFRSWSSRTL